MMPFFLTVPISRMIPMMLDHIERHAEQRQGQERAEPGLDRLSPWLAHAFRRAPLEESPRTEQELVGMTGAPR